MCGVAGRMELTKLRFTDLAWFSSWVKDRGLAVGEVVGHSSIQPAVRINGSAVLDVDSVEKVNKVVETGGVVNCTFVSVSPLTTSTESLCPTSCR